MIYSCCPITGRERSSGKCGWLSSNRSVCHYRSLCKSFVRTFLFVMTDSFHYIFSSLIYFFYLYLFPSSCLLFLKYIKSSLLAFFFYLLSCSLDSFIPYIPKYLPSSSSWLCLILHFLPHLPCFFTPSLLCQPPSLPLCPLEYLSFSFSLRGPTHGLLVFAWVCLLFTGVHLRGGWYSSTRDLAISSLVNVCVQIFACI